MDLHGIIASTVRRVGIWALVQALPDERVLQGYIRAAVMGIAAIIMGSVIAGSAMVAGMVALGRLLTAEGITPLWAGLLIGGLAILAVTGCFALAAHFFRRALEVKSDMAILRNNGGSALTRTFDSVTEGFLDGFTNPSKRTRQRAAEMEKEMARYEREEARAEPSAMASTDARIKKANKPSSVKDTPTPAETNETRSEYMSIAKAQPTSESKEKSVKPNGGTSWWRHTA